MGDLRRAIPARCFERSLLTSFRYLLVDLVAAAALYYASTFIDHPSVPPVLAYTALWPLYWFLQASPAKRQSAAVVSSSSSSISQ